MTLDCLRSLYADLGDLPAEVFVVDNASSDGSADAIGREFPEVRLIANSANLGFGAANNLAMSKAQGEYLLLLNSDAFPKAGAIATLVNYLQANPKVGIVGPRLVHADGSLQLSCFRFPSPLRAWLENLWISTAFADHRFLGDYRHWAHDSLRNVDWVIGACLLLRRNVFSQVGGFDEKFFMYSEEADWQRRIRDAGWDIAFIPDAVVTHLGGASGASEPARINRHFFESLDYYEYKHHGLFGLVFFRLAMIVGCSMRAMLWTIMLVFPKRRTAARAKTRLLSWLVVRQLTHWHINLVRHA
jgi:GT2 family glycosyltransferase